MSRAFSGSIASAAVMTGFPVRFNDFKAISVQITAAGTGCTISYEVSNDATTWYPAQGQQVNGKEQSPIITSAAVGLFIFPKQAKWFRARCSTYGSATPAYSAELHLEAPFVFAPGPVAVDWSYAALTGGIADTTPVALAVAAGAGLRNYLDAIQLFNADLTVPTEVEILSAATVLWRGWLPINDAGSGGNGIAINFPKGKIKTAANEALNIKAVTTSAILYANAQGHIGA